MTLHQSSSDLERSTSPPGIKGLWDEELQGGTSDLWLPLHAPKVYTNAFVHNKDKSEILLGYKKRGFGQGLWNGFGGKVDRGETILTAAKRELKEEACIDANLKSCGTLLFVQEGCPHSHLIHIFSGDEWIHTPEETEEMRPQWFSWSKREPTSLTDDIAEMPSIPYETMWEDDRYWFPLLLKGKEFAGRVDFSADSVEGGESKMLKYWFGSV